MIAVRKILDELRSEMNSFTVELKQDMMELFYKHFRNLELSKIENQYPFSNLDSLELDSLELKVEIVEHSPSVSRQRHLDIKLEDIGGATQLVLDKKYSYLVYKIVVVYIAMMLVVDDVLRFVCFRFASPTTLFAGVLGEIRYPP